MKLIKHSTAMWCTVILGSAFLVACGSTPKKNTQLENARSFYQTAANDPIIARSAAVQLRKSNDALENSEKLWKEGAKPVFIEHYAYLAKQRAAIAREIADLGLAENAMENAAAERDRALLEAKTIEAQKARQQAMSATERAERLEAQMKELNARKTDRGLVLTLGDVLFDIGQSKLKLSSKRTLDKLAKYLKVQEQRSVRIEGFTDSVGPEAWNQKLSEERANAVKEALVLRGVFAERIFTRGYGPKYPVASNDTPAGRQQNRRVEVIVSDEFGRIPERTEE